MEREPVLVKISVELIKTPKKPEVLIIFCFAEENLSRKLRKFLPAKMLRMVLSDFKNKPGDLKLVYTTKGRILLSGLGARKNLTPAKLRNAVQAATLVIRTLGVSEVQMLLPEFGSDYLGYLKVAAFAAIFGSYSFEHYRKPENKKQLKRISLISPYSGPEATQAVLAGVITARAANRARDLANHPGNVATPTHLAEHAVKSARQFGFKARVLDTEKIKKEKLGLLLGVSKGSDEPPKFIILEYGPKDQSPIVLIGKGLTFDSGGVSIKPAERMEEMKYDMCGGADVLGIFEAAAALKLKQRLVGLIPSTENLMSGKAVKPGDILTSHAGLTVEVINTDAEGRMVLADAISFAKKYYRPKLMIDYATLTGAALIALGDEYAGLMSNAKQWNKELKIASESTGEKFWELPLAHEYADQLKSNMADIKNLGERAGGVITAALFLEKFVGETPWMHFDIAGTAWTTKQKSYQSAGATAWGVYLTIDFLSLLNPPSKPRA
ncbi:MAG TPA: leucyl aminopeptidase [Patescibacteria group bacterium]|jgi:leucyl aminopeptidase|nr:leucyl aminopeptidase [Patescibacteria group bacterium]